MQQFQLQESGEELYFFDSNLSNTFHYLIENIKYNMNLLVLDVSKNNLNDDQCSSLVNVILSNEKMQLKSLSIAFNPLIQEDSNIIRLIEKSKSLDLKYVNNELVDSGVKQHESKLLRTFER